LESVGRNQGCKITQSIWLAGWREIFVETIQSVHASAHAECRAKHQTLSPLKSPPAQLKIDTKLNLNSRKDVS
jgi:hypothetical protein